MPLKQHLIADHFPPNLLTFEHTFERFLKIALAAFSRGFFARNVLVKIDEMNRVPSHQGIQCYAKFRLSKTECVSGFGVLRGALRESGERAEDTNK
jgi:hypothetical protein